MLQNPNAQILQLRIIWFAFMTAPVMFIIVTTIAQVDITMPDLIGFFEYIAIAVVIGFSTISQFLYSNFVQKASESDIQQKIQTYRTANILKGAMLEGAMTFSIVAYLLTHINWLPALIAGVLVWMFLQSPSLDKFKQDMAVTDNDLS